MDFKSVFNLNYEGKLEHPSDLKYGDYSTNIALITNRNPQEVKTELDNILDKSDIVEKVEIVGKFVNIFLKDKYLLKEAEKINYEIEFRNELGKLNDGKTMVIDYSAPNIAKPFGVGHLRSTNIGQAIYNLYKILGWNCIGDNHIGDFGTQFGKLIVAILKWSDKKIDKMTITDLESLYVRFHKEETPELLEEARNWFAKLEKGDEQAREIWKKCVDISMIEFNKMYELLDVNIDYVLGESFYQDKMGTVIKEMIEKGLTKESQGATIIEFDNETVELVKKGNETTTYFDRDMATIRYRIDRWNPDLIIYEVGADQSLYFEHVFETVGRLGWMKKDQLHHVAHGLIRWKDGKFSTRQGKTIHLMEVIEKIMEMAKKIAPENDEETIRRIAIGALKFNDLSQDPKKDIIFDWDAMMALDGDSGPYLQYTYARGQSVLKKSEIKEQKNIDTDEIILEEDEKKVFREIYKFKEKIIESAQRFNPGVLSDFLLSIARSYNEFYAKNKIIGHERENLRLFMTKSITSTIKLGLDLLGIKTVEKM